MRHFFCSQTSSGHATELAEAQREAPGLMPDRIDESQPPSHGSVQTAGRESSFLRRDTHCSPPLGGPRPVAPFAPPRDLDEGSVKKNEKGPWGR